MSDLHFDCPHCGRRIIKDEALCGTTVICPFCHGDVILPPFPQPNRPPAKVAQLILDPSENPTATAPVDDLECDVWNARPAARSFFGRLALGILLASLTVGLVPLAMARAFTGHLVLGVLLAPLIVGLVLFATVWRRVRTSRYRLTTQRLFVQQGVLMKRTDEIELYRVKDVRIDQSLLQRLLGVGCITVLSSDDTTPAVTLLGVVNPQDVKETIRTHYRAARKREGVRPSELIPSW